MSEQNPSPAQSIAPPRRRWRAWVRKLVTVCAGSFVFGVVLLVLVLDRELTAPSWVKQAVQDRAAVLLDGGRLQFGAITLRLGRDLHPRIRLIDGQVYGRDSALLARVPAIEAGVSPRGIILQGDILAQDIHVTGAQINLRRAADGSLAFALGPDAAQFAHGGDVAAWLGQLDGLFERPILAALTQISASGTIVNFDDARARRSWIVDGGAITLDLRGGALGMRAELSVLSGRADVARMTLALDRPEPRAPLQIALQISDVAARDLAAQLPAVGWLRDVDAPLSGVLRTSLDRAAQLGPLNAALEIGAGVLQPNPAVRPFRFDAAKAYLRYDPAQGRISFSDLMVQSEWGGLRASGTADMADFVAGLPRSFVGQFRLSNVTLAPSDLFEAPFVIGRADADLRLRLDPFRLDIGQIVVQQDQARLIAQGLIRAEDAGWHVALDGAIDQITPAQVLAFWPPALRRGARDWFARNVIAGQLRDLRGGLRLTPDRAPQISGHFGFSDASVKVLRDWPPLTQARGTGFFQDHSLIVAVDGGQITPAGADDAVAFAGSVFTIADLRIRPGQAQLDLHAQSSLPASLALMNQPPFRYLDRAGLPIDVAQGQAVTRGRINWPLQRPVPRNEVEISLTSDLTDVQSDRLVQGRQVQSPLLQLQLDRAGMEIRGGVVFDGLPADAVWQRRFGANAAGRSQLQAQFNLSPAGLADLGIVLPRGLISGQGRGVLQVDFAPETAPQFALTSDLLGLDLRLAALDWRKPAGIAGDLQLSGILGDGAQGIDLSLRAGDLRAEGQITRTAAGGLERAQFSQVVIGDWLDTQVNLVPDANGFATQVTGRKLDLRARLAAGDGAGSDIAGAVDFALAQVIISDSIALTDFQGRSDPDGLRFDARLNGQTAVTGMRDGAGAWQLRSDDAGGVLASAGLGQNIQGGALDLTLVPRDGNSFDGALALQDLRVRDAPALAALLDAISGIGLLQQLDGQGLAFDTVAATFRLTPDQVIVSQASAVGPGLGIAVDGFYDRASGVVDLQGVVSPLYVINQIGSLLTRAGEGVIGFNFTVTGTASALQVAVNPLSVLAPGMLRNLFRRPAPELTP
jgi:hypothetical protein